MANLQQPGKKKIKVTKNVDGHPVEEEIEVDDTGGPSWGPRAAHTLLNTELPRVDGPVKVTGRAVYSQDVRLPGMLYARVLVSPFPVATVELDLDAARKSPGVGAVIDLEVKGVKWLGQPVAAVAADTPERADDALRALAPKWKPGKWAVTREQALAANAPQVGRKGNLGKESSKGERAETEAAMQGAAAVVEAVYSVPVQHHVCLETHGVTVDFSGGDSAKVYASTQATFSIPGDAARELGLKASAVEGIVQYMGGGFGSKFGLGFEGQLACQLSKQAGKPVHLLLTRPVEFTSGGNRSGVHVSMKGAIRADGTLVALVSEAERFGGIGEAARHPQPYIYEFEKSFASSVSVLTHTDSSRAMRAPGHPQASFAMESLIDELCAKAGLDPLEVRKKNLKHEAYQRQLTRVAQEIGWNAHPNKTAPGKPEGRWCTGIGFGVSVWGGGGHPECEVEVRIERDGSVSSAVGSQDLGTGVRTYVASIVAEELGLPLGGVEARIGSSRLGQANGSGGSTTTGSLAPAVKSAAWNARTKFAEHLAQALGSDPAQIRFAAGSVEDQKSGRKLSFAQACAMLPQEGLTAKGEWVAELAGNGIQGAQAAKVRVDPLTGKVEVLKLVCVQNCGLPINRLTLRSQIAGGMVQALSYGLLEERVIDPDLGLALNANLEDYKVAGPLEIGEIVALIDDEDTREQAIGVAEATVIPGHSAIANAVFNACGARVRDMPLTPDKVLAALGRV
ncbi:MAG: xanthine dehydrogenase family protein molybdopterin-binding subunit [Planctomycetes bacterium]|nr:xanthine dehydrogenase family protein molybdopterin-binding subunit [Planctomycetota bacterium]